MSLPLLRLQQGAEEIATGLQHLSPDLARVLLDYLFGPKYIQVIVTQIGDLGNDGAEFGEATEPELSTATSLFVPFNAEGLDGWLVSAFPSSPATDGTTVMIDVEYYGEEQRRYGEYGGSVNPFEYRTTNPIAIPSDAALGLTPYNGLYRDDQGFPHYVTQRSETGRWKAWTRRLLDTQHQADTGILTQMPPFHKIVRTLVLRLSPLDEI